MNTQTREVSMTMVIAMIVLGFLAIHFVVNSSGAGDGLNSKWQSHYVEQGNKGMVTGNTGGWLSDNN